VKAGGIDFSGIFRKLRPDFWNAPGLFTAWGFDATSPQWSAAELAGKARAAGFRWVAVQTTTGMLLGNALALRDAGLKAVLWGLPGSVWDTNDLFEGYIVQIENPDQYREAVHVLPSLPTPRAVVTTFGGEDTKGLVKPLLKYTSTALVECYKQDDPIHADIDRMMWQAAQYGWPRAHPVLGLYGGIGLGGYVNLGKRQFSVWTAEEMSDQDWIDLASHHAQA
jgi:hypothetical protein